MQLFYTLLGINRLIFQFIRNKDLHSYAHTEEFFTNKLTTFHRDIEDTYYNQVLYPKLQNIWHMEKETFVACILCILSIINSDHIK